MFTKVMTSKWMSLFCTLVNSTFGTMAWNSGDYMWALVAYGFSFFCAYNFITAVKEDYYDQDQ